MVAVLPANIPICEGGRRRVPHLGSSVKYLLSAGAAVIVQFPGRVLSEQFAPSLGVLFVEGVRVACDQIEKLPGGLRYPKASSALPTACGDGAALPRRMH